MCGIFGFLGTTPLDHATIQRVHGLQRHRGPDDERSWIGRVGESWLTLAFQRLAIIDLTANGAQPFHSSSGSVLVFNGEIYNYVELRTELKAAGVVFHTASDTEVLLATLEHYGIENALARVNGMFGFAWLCGKTGRLWIARDRVGEKPLYYYCRDARNFAFASEIKSLLAVSPDASVSPDPQVVHSFLVNGVVDDTEKTFFAGIKSLRPAQYAEITSTAQGIEIRPRDYWPRSNWDVENSRPLADNVELIRELLSDAVRIRLRSDVPLGFLVSGGLDSSIITAMSLQHGVDRERLSAFSIVNPNVAADETRWIESVTNHLGISVRKVVFDPQGQELLDLIDQHVQFHDEPFSGLSVVAHVELMKAARDHGVTVLLSGQGGDELFCGYRKYFYFAVQQLLRQGRIGRTIAMAWPFLRNETVLRQFSAADAARYTRIRLPGVPHLPLGSCLADIQRTNIGLRAEDVRHRQMADLLRFSTPAITHAEDRASMALSREVRFPYFDPRVMEAALALPLDQKIGDGWTKRALRLVGKPLLPDEIVWRKDKTGHFSATTDWLIRSGGEMMRQRIHDRSLVFDFGFLDAHKALPRWNAFWRGERSEYTLRQVLSVLTLESWLHTFSRSVRSTATTTSEVATAGGSAPDRYRVPSHN
jgi:asparagine synthase (glutamine-hydrolysing)